MGIVSSLIWSTYRLRKETLEERNKWETQRKYDAKKEAFINFADSLMEVTSIYYSLPNLIPTHPERFESASIRLGQAAVKLHFFCGIESIEEIESLGISISKAAQNATEPLLPAMSANKEIQRLQKRISEYEEIINTKGLMADRFAAQSGLVDFEKVNLEIGLVGERKKVLLERVSELRSDLDQQLEKVRNEIVSSLPDITVKQAAVLLRARRDLDLPIDENRYIDLLRSSTKESLDMLKKRFSASS